MKNRDVYRQDPDRITLLNNGVAAMTDALDPRTSAVRCDSSWSTSSARASIGSDWFVSWSPTSAIRASPSSRLRGSAVSSAAASPTWRRCCASCGRTTRSPEDGASARGLARLPDDVLELLTEVTTIGRRGHGLHAAAGTLGGGTGDSVRLALLGVVFKSLGLPEGFPQARFCLWLKKNGIYDRVGVALEELGRNFRRELNDLYVSPLIAKALLAADPSFADSEKEARRALRNQFPKPQ